MEFDSDNPDWVGTIDKDLRLPRGERVQVPFEGESFEDGSFIAPEPGRYQTAFRYRFPEDDDVAIFWIINDIQVTAEDITTKSGVFGDVLEPLYEGDRFSVELKSKENLNYNFENKLLEERALLELWKTSEIAHLSD